MVRLIILIVLICSRISFTLSCMLRVIKQEPAEAFCSSEIVGLFTVTSGPTDCGPYRHCYDLESVDILRGEPYFKINRANRSSRCGINLHVGDTMLLMGKYYLHLDEGRRSGGGIDIPTCKYEEKWSLSDRRWDITRTSFYLNIECPVNQD
ncbi:hypothetical protein HDE_08607 [Halotydeus destructor]|nr:hypothetical protein HDE_08607 [Halotydeus destructor]